MQFGKCFLRGSCAFLLACLAAALFYPNACQAFCIYNKSDAAWYVDQVQGDSVRSPFAPKLGPGDEKCCRWNNRDCNSSGRSGSRVAFDVKSSLSSSSGVKVPCRGVTIAADGFFTIKGSKGYYYCEVE